MDDQEEIRKQLVEWEDYCARNALSHAIMTGRLTDKRKIIGVPSVICSVIVSTAVFAEISKSSDNEMVKFMVVALVLLSAVLSGLQTFLNYGEAGQVHNAARKKFAHVRLKIQSAYLKNTISESDVANIVSAMEKADELEPAIPNKLWEKIKAEKSDRVKLTNISSSLPSVSGPS